ncbi:hypothetical protein IQ06DRAFT_374456 [Phaeosphaeriaceae sp. SRC1lsM3a]|nr:hypothetical protein IQ06DRAFT_374456 [Stagonospora sp. SRC1lsM3a]
MKLNSFDLFALLECSCLCGIIVGVFNMTSFITDREVVLLLAFNAVVIFFVCVSQLTKDNLTDYFLRHQCEIESRQLGDLQEAHRRRILLLKAEHKSELHHLQGIIHGTNSRYDRLEAEYDWVTTAYRDQMRTMQEQEDRINYLEHKLREASQASPTIRQPYSAPSSQIQFAKPPRCSRGSVAAGAPSPLSQVTKANEIEEQ